MDTKTIIIMIMMMMMIMMIMIKVMMMMISVSIRSVRESLSVGLWKNTEEGIIDTWGQLLKRSLAQV